MTYQDITKLTEKYSPKEITTAIRVLVDVLDMQKKSDFETIELKDEFTSAQVKRLQKQLSEHDKKKSQSLSFNQVKNALGL